MAHQFTSEMVRDIVKALDEAGVDTIEISHGDGLGGSSFNYGFSKEPEMDLIKVAAETVHNAEAGRAAAARHRHARGPQGRRELRRQGCAHRHPLHRGRHLAAAHRPRQGDGHGGHRLPDDGPHDLAGAAAGAGAPHGELRRRLRLRHRLRRRPDAGRLPRPRPRPASKASTSR